MKKLTIIGLISISLLSLSNENFIIDKEVTGTNLEQLESFDNQDDIGIITENEIIYAKDKDISFDNINSEKEILKSRESSYSFDGSLTETGSKSRTLKIILGIVTVIAIGIAL